MRCQSLERLHEQKSQHIAKIPRRTRLTLMNPPSGCARRNKG
jgi:hypothetical protein